MSTTTEKIVQQEQEELDRAQAAETPDTETGHVPGDEEEPDEEQQEQPHGGQQAAFDRSQYEKEGLAISKIDDQPVDRIGIKFAGEVMLDRSDKADVALFNKLKLGKAVELRVAGVVQRSTGAKATGRDGDLDVIVGSKTLKIDSVWVLEPEQL